MTKTQRVALLTPIFALLVASSCSFLSLFAPQPIPYLTSTPAQARSAAIVPSPTSEQIVTVVAFATLYLRSGPSMEYEPLETLDYAERLVFTGKCRFDQVGTAWISVRAMDGKNGWVSARYVDPYMCY